MRKLIGVLLIIVAAGELGGCSTVQKKFTRKKKEPAHVAQVVYIDQGPYQKKYSNEYYYKMHYTLWKGWQDEWIAWIGGNRKKVARDAEEALNHLDEMQKYLTPAKQEELGKLILELRGIQDRSEHGQYAWNNVGPVKVELEKLKRLIANDFSYEKAKNDVLPENVDLGAPSGKASAAS